MNDKNRTVEEPTQDFTGKETSNENLIKRLEEAVKGSKKAQTEMVVLKTQNSSEEKEDETTAEQKDDHTHDKQENSDSEAFKRFLNIALIVFVIVLIIVTVGWFFSKLNRTDYEDAVIVEDEDELEVKKQRLKEVENKITPLELKKAEIQKTEKRYLITARVVIGVGMLLINAWFANNYIYFNDTFELNKILSFNSAILLCYSFVAFILYGTPANFVAALKNIISNFLKNKHVDTLTELEKLIEEKEILFKEIEALEKK